MDQPEKYLDIIYVGSLSIDNRLCCSLFVMIGFVVAVLFLCFYALWPWSLMQQIMLLFCVLCHIICRFYVCCS